MPSDPFLFVYHADPSTVRIFGQLSSPGASICIWTIKPEISSAYMWYLKTNGSDSLCMILVLFLMGCPQVYCQIGRAHV